LVSVYVKYVKRCLDFFLSFLGIIILFPVLLTVAIFVKFDSSGSIFFQQKRIAKGGREFIVYKFRSMRVDAPEQSAHSSDSLKNYVTKLGKFMRATGIDELPQLFNILKGDMAIVGPRPCLYNDYELIDLRSKHGVNIIRPGLTSLSKLKDVYGHKPRDKIKIDIEYKSNISFSLDMEIFLTTIKLVFLKRNEK